MQTQLIVLSALVLLAVVILLIVFLRRAERARTEAMQQAGLALGFTFEPTADVDRLKAVADLPVFNHGHSRRAYNFLSGRSGGVEVKIFDYRYTTGGGQHQQTSIQTVALYSSGVRTLPDFVLAPENVFHKIGQAFGYHDIDFESNPTFSSRYLLRGADETAIRAAFRPDTLAFLESQLGWSVQARSGNVAVYRAGKRAKPDALPTFVEETRAVARALTGR